MSGWDDSWAWDNVPTSSGSGAGVDQWNNSPEYWCDPEAVDRFDGALMVEGEEETFAVDNALASGETLEKGQLMSPKIPPAYDGSTSWFSYEELVNDWLDITTLDAEKQGPSLKTRLTGTAAMYKHLLDRTTLKRCNRRS